MNTKRQTKLLRQRGLTRIEVLAITAVVIVLGSVLLVSSVTMANSKGKRAACQNNLMQIGLSFRTLVGNRTNLFPMNVSTSVREFTNAYRHYAAMSNEINNPFVLVCPSDNRTPWDNFSTFNNNYLSYFAGLDLDEQFPAMMLSGDRNLVTNGIPVLPGLVVITSKDTVAWSDKMHRGAGNVGLADGSVQQSTSEGLQKSFQKTGVPTNRLAVP